MSNPGYSGVANKLVGRIFCLIDAHPEILEMEDCWDLFKIKEFKCDDLGPTMFQASWALSRAKIDYKNSKMEGGSKSLERTAR